MASVLRRVAVVIASMLLIGAALALPLSAGGEDGDGNAAETQYGGGQGCTPGYWKNNLSGWSDTPYTTDKLFSSVFGQLDGLDPSLTLLQALNLEGGGVNALARHAVAALLNSTNENVSYGFTVEQILETIENAEGDWELAKDTFASENESGCPINAFGELTG